MAPDRGSVTKLYVLVCEPDRWFWAGAMVGFWSRQGFPAMPFSFVPCSDIETGNDCWALNDFENRRIHVLESWQIQSFMDKRYGIVHENKYKLMD